MANRLSGKKVAALAADMVERVELEEPLAALRDNGADVDLLSIHDGEIRTFDHFDPAGTASVDRVVSDADPGDYDALFVPGGVGNPDQLRMDDGAVRFVHDFAESGKPVGFICHAGWILVEADEVRGRRVTGWSSIGTDVRNAGGEFVQDEAVVHDGNFVSSRGPDDLPAFNEALVDHFAHAPVAS